MDANRLMGSLALALVAVILGAAIATVFAILWAASTYAVGAVAAFMVLWAVAYWMLGDSK